ncbi:MAG TPA: transketolase [Armatimonadota bacterium]|jgi:transketolase
MADTQARPDIGALKETARLLRKDVVEMTTKAGSGHPSSSISAAEVVAGLYFGGILEKNPAEPKDPNRDRFILSKGHACPVLYAALAETGYFPKEWMDHLRQIDAPLEGHPNLRRVPGIEASTGSLGQGLSVAVGVALAGHMDDKPYKVYVMTGDGEIDEGQIWEAAASAAKFILPNIVWIVDKNGYQQTGSTHDVMPMAPLADKIRSFGWHVREINGQDMVEVMDALQEAKAWHEGPYCIISNTKKGAGISFVEADFSYHGKALTKEEAGRALIELGFPEEAAKYQEAK